MSNVVDTRRDTSALTWIQSTTDFHAEASVGSIRPDLALASVSQPAVPEGTEIDTVLLIVAFAIPNLQSFNNLQAASGFPPWIWEIGRASCRETVSISRLDGPASATLEATTRGSHTDQSRSP